MDSRKFRKGFTLAEVLITLAIIGIVAAITIPTISSNTRGGEYKAAFKKAVSSLNQAIMMSIAQDSLDANTFGATANTSSLANFFVNKMSVISQNTATDTNPWWITGDGIKYTVTKRGGTCNSANATTDDPSVANCVILVDVNGDKGPGKLATGTDTTSYAYYDQYYVTVTDRLIFAANNTTSSVARAVMLNQ